MNAVPKLRRKSAAAISKYRREYRKHRDSLILGDLRALRDIARAEIVASGRKIEPLSVYTSVYFPLIHQMREKPTKIDNGFVKGVDGIRFECDSMNMPQWKDLSMPMKMELFQLLCEEHGKCLHTFNPKIHPDLLKELMGKDVVSSIRQRIKAELDRLGELPKHHVFVVEGRSKAGLARDLHIHGMAMVSDTQQASEMVRATGRAAGQEVKGRGKLASGNRGEYCYYEKGKSWVRYITKNSGKAVPGVSRRHEVFSRPAVQMTKEFYELVTGQDCCDPKGIVPSAKAKS